MKTLLLGTTLSALMLFGTQPARADVTVAGDYVKFGVGDNGALIDFTNTIGIQFDPSGAGNFSGNIDFLTPGTPFAFSSIGVNGAFSVAGAGSSANPFGSTTSVSSMAGSTSVHTSGGSYGGLSISQVIRLDAHSKVLHSSVVLTNVSGATLQDVVYAIGMDPDPDYFPYGSGDTTNNLKDPGPHTSVEAIGPATAYAIQLISTTDWVATTPSVNATWTVDPYVLSSTSTNDGFGDNAIALGYRYGNLEAGQQITIEYDIAISSPVPEPQIYAMLLAGLGLAAFTARRSQS
jgi:hypothetical protein